LNEFFFEARFIAIKRRAVFFFRYIRELC
jgi:hypothetical protein